ncbi:hypothetical protein LAh9_143 [Aeromonas phage LAh_9]|uniref:Virion structural protein n=1 Tax=Aeromonas phage LAh_9 TaxID=2591033 RepID=A0A514A0R3_9CAUD|nr:tail fiber protein; host specificity [Aeromonas phage LAh_9]QDH46867.1 hypothetical protein LAh9_143 [Aeromonas phage LAh_9]
MPTFRVRGIGKVGTIKDLPPFELPPEAWSTSNNVRFVGGRVEKMGGMLPVLTTNMPDETPLCVFQKSNTNSVIYGTPTSIYRIDGISHFKISRNLSTTPGQEDFYVYGASPEDRWYYTSLSNSIIMNYKGDNPQGLRPTDDYFVNLPGWGIPSKEGVQKTWRCGRIRAFRNYLIALDMVEDGVELPQRVRWSNVSFVNELPPDWVEDDDKKDGGFNDLTDSIGKIVDGHPLRDSFVVYTDKDTYLMDYVGGVFIFNFRKLFSDSGLLAPNCVAEFEGQHFVVAQDDIFIHNGSSRKPVASGRLKEYLINEISGINSQATQVFSNTSRKEIWITYAGTGSIGADKTGWSCNKAAVWNWEYDTWSFYDLPQVYDINMAPPPETDTLSWDQLCGTEADPPNDSIIPIGCEDVWDSDKWSEEQWQEYGKDFIRRVIYCASKDKCLYLLDTGTEFVDYDSVNKTNNPRPIVAELIRTHLDMDEAVESTRRYKMIRHIVPQFSGTGEVLVFYGGSENSTNPPTWDGYQVYNIEEDVKVDSWSNNRYPAIKFVDSSGGTWSFTGYDIDFIQEGLR